MMAAIVSYQIFVLQVSVIWSVRTRLCLEIDISSYVNGQIKFLTWQMGNRHYLYIEVVVTTKLWQYIKQKSTKYDLKLMHGFSMVLVICLAHDSSV
jgi:hypothetical protein